MFRTPHASIRDENPVFDFELRRVKRLASPGRLWLYSALLQVIPLFLVAIGYFASLWAYAIRYGNSSASGSNYYYSDAFYSGWTVFAVVTLAASGLTAFFGGIYYMAVSVHSINTQVNNGHWDMLRLSPLADATVLRAKEAIAHIRAWRLMHLEVALRVAQITLLGLLITFQPYDMVDGRWFGEYGFIGRLIRDITTQPFITLMQISIVFTASYAWIVEPRWRMRTITTIGLALSARVHSLSTASVAAFFGLLGFHLAQAALLYAVFWLSIELTEFARQLRYSLSGVSAYVAYTVFPMLIIMCFLFVVYLTYWAGRRLAWRSALRQAFKPEQ